MKYALDANSCIYLLNNSIPALTERVARCDAGMIGISSVAFAEVAIGSANGKPPSMELLDAFLGEVPLLVFDEAAARAYARLPFKRGRFDRLVGAHAISLGLTIITSNVADFADIPDLSVEDWSRPLT